VSEFDGKTVVVTGGSSGIGRGVATAFADAGAFVLISDIDEVKGQALAEELGKDKASFVATDVSIEAHIENCIANAMNQTGRIDCFVNNAGIGDATASVEEVSVEKIQKLFSVLLGSAMLSTKHVVPIMRESGGGVILNTASVRGVMTSSGAPVYSCLKAGLIHWTRNVAPSLATDNIRINCVSPGGIPTPLAAEGIPGESMDETLATLSELMVTGQPIKRVGQPRDIANAMLFLAGSSGDWITGQNFVVDGGHSAISLEG